MAETLPVVDQARIAEAVARLVARQAQLLSRADEDAGAAGAARMGLAWLAELLRSLDAPGAAAWFQALRERPGAWSALGAPVCERLAAALEAAHTLEPLSDEVKYCMGSSPAYTSVGYGVVPDGNFANFPKTMT